MLLHGLAAVGVLVLAARTFANLFGLRLASGYCSMAYLPFLMINVCLRIDVIGHLVLRTIKNTHHSNGYISRLPTDRRHQSAHSLKIAQPEGKKRKKKKEGPVKMGLVFIKSYGVDRNDEEHCVYLSNFFEPSK